MSIRVITEPMVRVVGRQMVEDRGIRDFLAAAEVAGWTTDSPKCSEKLVEVAGRLCYMSFRNPRPGGNEAYIGHLLEVGHGSVLEHAVWSVIVTGISRSLSHELVRHRVGLSVSQLSQRFVDSSDVAFVLPPAIRPGSEEYRLWKIACEMSANDYGSLAERLERSPNIRAISDSTARRKAAREASRSVLPNCAETKVFLTGNARAWRHLMALRGSLDADAEFRRLAVALFRALQPEAPHTFQDVAVATDPVRGEYLTVAHPKV